MWAHASSKGEVRGGHRDMKVNFAHLCDYAMIADGKLGVIGIFSIINVPQLPHTHTQMYVAFELGAAFRRAEQGIQGQDRHRGRRREFALRRGRRWDGRGGGQDWREP